MPFPRRSLRAFVIAALSAAPFAPLARAQQTDLQRAAQQRQQIEAARIRAAAQAREQAQARAQGQPQQAAGLDPNSFYGKDSTEGVYVRDSALALEKFAHAQRMERQKEWNKAADLYQEILEKYSDRVVPSQVDAEAKI